MSPKIQAILDTALEQVRAALLEEASAAVRHALEGRDEGPIPIPFKPRGKPGPKPKATKRPKGAKRDPKEIEALAKAFVAQVKKTPGQNVETLAKSLGATTKDLQLPVIKAWEMKAIKSTGQKRGTKYFPK